MTIDFRKLHAEKERLQPNDTRYHMLRAVLNAKLEEAINGLAEDLKLIHVERFAIDKHGHIFFKRYLGRSEINALMRKHFGVSNNIIPIPVPPKHWGLKILTPTPE